MMGDTGAPLTRPAGALPRREQRCRERRGRAARESVPRRPRCGAGQAALRRYCELCHAPRQERRKVGETFASEPRATIAVSSGKTVPLRHVREGGLSAQVRGGDDPTSGGRRPLPALAAEADAMSRAGPAWLSRLAAVGFLLAVARGDAARAWAAMVTSCLVGLLSGRRVLALLQLTRARWGGPVTKERRSAGRVPAGLVALAYCCRSHGSFYLAAAARRASRRGSAGVSSAGCCGLALRTAWAAVPAPPARASTRPRADRVRRGVVVLPSTGDVARPRWFSTLIGGHFFIGTLKRAGATRCWRAGPGPALRPRSCTPPAAVLGFCMLWIYLVYTQYLGLVGTSEETGFVRRAIAGAPGQGWPSSVGLGSSRSSCCCSPADEASTLGLASVAGWRSSAS